MCTAGEESRKFQTVVFEVDEHPQLPKKRHIEKKNFFSVEDGQYNHNVSIVEPV